MDKIIKQHVMWNNAGPLWNGHLWDKKLAKKIAIAAEQNKDVCMETKKLTKVIAEEAQVDNAPFLDIHILVKNEKIKNIPPFEKIMSAIKKKKYNVARTHFVKTGMRTTMSREQMIMLIKKL